MLTDQVMRKINGVTVLTVTWWPASQDVTLLRCASCYMLFQEDPSETPQVASSSAQIWGRQTDLPSLTNTTPSVKLCGKLIYGSLDFHDLQELTELAKDQKTWGVKVVGICDSGLWIFCVCTIQYISLTLDPPCFPDISTQRGSESETDLFYVFMF